MTGNPASVGQHGGIVGKAPLCGVGSSPGCPVLILLATKAVEDGLSTSVPDTEVGDSEFLAPGFCLLCPGNCSHLGSEVSAGWISPPLFNLEASHHLSNQ